MASWSRSQKVCESAHANTAVRSFKGPIVFGESGSSPVRYPSMRPVAFQVQASAIPLSKPLEMIPRLPTPAFAMTSSTDVGYYPNPIQLFILFAYPNRFHLSRASNAGSHKSWVHSRKPLPVQGFELLRETWRIDRTSGGEWQWKDQLGADSLWSGHAGCGRGSLAGKEHQIAGRGIFSR